MGSRGRSYVYTKEGAFTTLDGSSTNSLFIQPGQAISHISAGIEPTQDAAAVAHVSALLKLQFFSGATPSGSGWTGGAWTTFWQMPLMAWSNSNVVGDYFSTMIEENFDPPIEIPSPFQSTLLAGGSHAKVGQRVTANTHNAAEVAGEWDIRAILTVVAGSATNFKACINVCAVASDN